MIMAASNKESLGIQRVASMHLFVRDLERSRDHDVRNLDFAEIAKSTPDFEMEHRARASVVEAGGARFVLMEPLGSKGESFHWLERHPEGIGRIVFEVENDRIERIDEDVDVLRKLQVLVDGNQPGKYLLQIFMREAAGLFKDPKAGPLFIELIQRKGDQGFGAGNFRALFESIERQQQGEGRA